MDSEAMDTVGIIISPSIDRKIKTRNAAMRLKNGVPQFKDVLRKRFLVRIKENRGRLFNRLRDANTSVKSNVFDIIHQEVSSIVTNNDFISMDEDEEDNIKKEMESEALLEQESWLMHHFDLFMADDNTIQQLWEDFQQVTCPVCKKGNLICRSSAQEIQCNHCLMVLPARASLQAIQARIYTIIESHDETGCESDTIFFVSQGDNSLYAHCCKCPFFDLAV